MQHEAVLILKNRYESTDLGWYSNNQIRIMLINIGIDASTGAVTKGTGKAYLSGFLDRVPYGRGFLYRYRIPKKNNKINFLR